MIKSMQDLGPVEIIGEDNLVWRTRCGGHPINGCPNVMDRPKRTGRPLDYTDPKSETVWTVESVPTRPGLCISCGPHGNTTVISR